MRFPAFPEVCSVAAALVVSFPLFLAPASARSPERVVYPFSDCWGAIAPLIADSTGNLYGTTSGGDNGVGSCVFELTASPDGTWSEMTLYRFTSSSGWGPAGALVFDKEGSLYGTTERGGSYDSGVAFKLSPALGGAWTETVLYNFGNGDDGWGPQSQLVFDSAGNLYGTTFAGGPHHGGTVFRLTPGPNGWTETILYSFWGQIGGPGPCEPSGGILMDTQGNLYGVTSAGGNKGGYGAAYELVLKDGTYKELTIHSFDGYDGWSPDATLIMDSYGNLYGTAQFGGSRQDICPGAGCGTVFELTKGQGGKWSATVLYSLGENGIYAVGPLAMDSKGNLYAAATAGGFLGQGSVFALTPQQNGSWYESVLHFFHYYDRHFRSGKDGELPYAGVILSGGKLYGTTSTGGIHDEGTVFEIDLQCDTAVFSPSAVLR